ncbi:MAG: type II secretion system F family protein [Alphaproteobacteria bacterium]
MSVLVSILLFIVGVGLIFGFLVLWRAEQDRHDREVVVLQRLRRLRTDQRLLDWPEGEGRFLELLPNWIPDFVRVRVARADINPSPNLVVVVAGFLGSFLILLSFIVNIMVELIIIAALVAVIWITIEMIAARRLAEFRETLPGYFDRVRQLLLIGNTLQQALGRAMAAAPDQSKRYLEPMVRRIDHGATVAEAAGWLANRIDVPELHMFHTAIDTNLRYGGRITDILGNLISMLKDQDRVRRELAAATSETRGSAAVLTALPFVIGTGFAIINPSYISFFFIDPTGHMLFGVAVGLVLAGALILRRMMRQGGVM